MTETTANALIFGNFAWIGIKSLFWVISGLATLIFIESYFIENQSWPSPIEVIDSESNISQLRLYAELLTAIFSIYFATIGIILSAGYIRLRRDIIQMLTNEQIGSFYSRILVFTAMFCLAAAALPSFQIEPGLFVYIVGTVLTFLSALSLFPLGQRLFNFFDLNVLVRSEILPNIVRHIECAASRENSISLASHHSKAARRSLEQLSYIDDRVKDDEKNLGNSLPSLTSDYTNILIFYLDRKYKIERESYWFPKKRTHRQWFFAGDTATTMALKTSSQLMLVEDKPDHQWLENEIVDRLAGHIELAFRVGDFELALKLLGRFSSRVSAYATRFEFDVGMTEIKRFKNLIEQALGTEGALAHRHAALTRVGVADTWAALGGNLCLETLRRMLTFEKELQRFFDNDEWSRESIRGLPAFLQLEITIIIDRVHFEQEIEGRRLSGRKYLQQLAVQKLLQRYEKILCEVCDFYQILLPKFSDTLINLKMPEAATQVLLASLHSHWKLPRWFDEIGDLLSRYRKFEHYAVASYALPTINVTEMADKIGALRDVALATLGGKATVGHIFEPKINEELPDHFGQIYFELAEACIDSLERNDADKLDKFLPMFMALTFTASDSKFVDPKLQIDNEFRLHLISTVINDLTSVLGFAILYGEYFDNHKLSEGALAQFDVWVGNAADQQQYLKRMLLLSDPLRFSMSASPRALIRMNWKMSFEHRSRHDGFGDRMGMTRGEQHPSKIVREFLNSHSEASDLFFAIHVLPNIDVSDGDIDHQIAHLARRLDIRRGEVAREDH